MYYDYRLSFITSSTKSSWKPSDRRDRNPKTQLEPQITSLACSVWFCYGGFVDLYMIFVYNQSRQTQNELNYIRATSLLSVWGWGRGFLSHRQAIYIYIYILYIYIYTSVNARAADAVHRDVRPAAGGLAEGLLLVCYFSLILILL